MPNIEVDEETLPDLQAIALSPCFTEIVARAFAIVEEVAEVIVEAATADRPRARTGLSALVDPEEVVGYLLDPNAPEQRLDELRAELDKLVALAKTLRAPRSGAVA
jgi:hypothetical protein